MKTKLCRLAGAAALLCLAALAVFALLARGGAYRNLLLVYPLDIYASGVNVEKAEQFCEDEFLITWETRTPAQASAHTGKSSVTLIGTNSAYAAIMGFQAASGAFFPKSAWDGKLRVCTLNEAAAFALFGSVTVSGASLTINGAAWRVSGVIRDGNDAAEGERVVYAPSSVTGGAAAALLCLIDSGGVKNESYAANALASIGVNSAHFEFINTGAACDIYTERALFALALVVCVTVFLLIKKTASGARQLYVELRTRRKRFYLGELIRASCAALTKMFLAMLFCLAAAAFILLLLRNLFAAALAWADMPSLREAALRYGEEILFPQKLRLLWLLEIWDAGLFWACCGFLALFVIFSTYLEGRRAYR